MTAISAFRVEVARHVPSAPEPLIDEAILLTAIDFCSATNIAQATVTANVVANAPTVTFTPPADTSTVSVMQLWHAGKQVFPAVPDQVDLAGAYSGATEVGDPKWFFDAALNTVRVYPLPKENVANGWVARVSVCPADAATTVPDVLWDDWRLAISAGARAYIKSIPNQPFSMDPKRDEGVYRAAVSAATAAARLQRNGGNLSVRPLRPFISR